MARKAGATVSGVAGTREAVRGGKARLVLLAGDAAEGQLSKLEGVLKHRKVPVRVWGDRMGLGAVVGAGPRSALAVTSATFAHQLLERLPASNRPGPRGARR